MKMDIFPITVALAAMLAGCGGSNPTKDYGDLKEKAVPAKTFTPEKEYVVETKTVYGGTKDLMPSDMLVIKPQPGMFFAEGVATSYPVEARVLFKGVGFDLVADSLPAGAKLEKSTTQANMWVLSWTAAYGTVGSETAKEFPIVFRMTNLTGPKEALDELNKINSTFSTSIVVIRKLGQPVVLKISGLTDTIDEGADAPFTVDVKAAGRKPENPPHLLLTYNKAGALSVDSKTGEAIPFEESGVRYILMKSEDQAPTYLNSEGVWRYKFHFVASERGGISSGHKKDGSLDEKATHLYVRFTLVATSGELESEPLTTHLKIKLAEPAKGDSEKSTGEAKK